MTALNTDFEIPNFTACNLAYASAMIGDDIAEWKLHIIHAAQQKKATLFTVTYGENPGHCLNTGCYLLLYFNTEGRNYQKPLFLVLNSLE
ncbi:hypothetical protein GOBAR_AA08336 [Gossypium barbadense]|uniref:Uncharacterized protein n=1 Tax=Gossypium barbadense TaxID=3634 RepID=A0A2P5Y9N0_GOSBA|nr:hypothetical protein GOBAR_AA08336 [Gossypium barbadense]